MERGSEGISTPDPFEGCDHWPGHGSDDDADSRASTNFSSCEESEFDRYCSANSVLGSASICSSATSEFLESFMSVGPGDDCVSEGSSVRERHWRSRRHGDGGACVGRFDALSDGEGGSTGEYGVADHRFSPTGSDVLFRVGTGSKRCPGLVESDDKNLIPSSNDVESEYEKLRLQSYGNALEVSPSSAITVRPGDDTLSSKKSIFFSQGSNSLGQLTTESAPDEDSSSRYEHSEGEDSLPDYGTDAENGIHVNRNGNFHRNWKDRPKNENPLLLSSSVAFGNDDWDDFVRETEVNALDPVPLYGDEGGKDQGYHFETENNILERPCATSIGHFGLETTMHEDVKDIREASYQAPHSDKSIGKVTDCIIMNPLMESEPSTIQMPIVSSDTSGFPDIHVANEDLDSEKEVQWTSRGKFVDVNGNNTAERLLYANHSLNPHCDNTASQVLFIRTKESHDKDIGAREECKIADILPQVQKGHEFADIVHTTEAANQFEKQDTTEFHDEMVLEMEEILLESVECHGGRLLRGNQGCMSQKFYHIRDGSSTASTSGMDDGYMGSPHPLSIDWIEVVGAKQKKGDVSFGERLVGVKEYTIYKLRVQSGKDQWEVERRYRDFFTLYRQLKALFTDHGLSLPSPWTCVERESRNIFGNASPSVISQRSTLIQDCLRAILHFRFPLGTPSPLIWFLSPSKDSHPLYHSPQKVSTDIKSNSSYCGESCTEEVSTLGKTISLVVEVKVRKSVRQLLEAQRYMCAGCHRQLDAGKTLMQELVQTFGWGNPRLCEYTGQLFCLTCHTNDTAVLPARALHHWDFSLYPVSQLAKAYLDSIYDQPMLCVSAVNPFLFSKVPTLLHIMGIRKKIASMLPYVRCPFRRSIHRGLGSRRYLLENNEFFALRDLVDLSKGAFSALPALVKTVEIKILDHIAQQCLICYDTGVPCAARQACNDPSSLIFPFQEAEAVRCSSCHLLFHQPCIAKMGSCPCGKLTPVDGRLHPAATGSRGANIELDGFVDAQTENSDAKTLAGFFSDLMSKARPGKFWKPRTNNHVILMGSLPGTMN
uniref:Pleckstrin y domain-containing family M member 3 n=1 Tax=Anthurium amnicola TaxID=1678845 RepID=A0A1D1Z2Q9_9ARAE